MPSCQSCYFLSMTWETLFRTSCLNQGKYHCLQNHYMYQTRCFYFPYSGLSVVCFRDSRMEELSLTR